MLSHYSPSFGLRDWQGIALFAPSASINGILRGLSADSSFSRTFYALGAANADLSCKLQPGYLFFDVFYHTSPLIARVFMLIYFLINPYRRVKLFAWEG